MANNHEIELPLYDAFKMLMQLEKNQTNKGIDPQSYLLLIDVLRKGYALNSKEELLFFCKKLWLKPFHTGNAAITEEVLENVILENLRAYEAFNEKKDPGTIDNNSTQVKTKENDLKKKDGKENIPEEKKPVKDEEDAVTHPEPVVAKTTGPARLVINITEQPADSTFEQQDYSHFFNDKKFKFNYTYLTVSPRFIEQTIRSLRYKVRGTGKPVIDIEATVKDAGSKGYFDSWKFREEEDFVTRWTLFFDRDGSMIAFHGLQDALEDAAFKGTIKNDGDLFYFRNIAKDILFTNPQRTRSVPFSDIVNGPVRNILIVSDAGAARGTYNKDRIQDTFIMIKELRKHRVAWLNPLPKARWKNSSAEVVARFVNMFESGHDYSDDLGNIVRLFKSKIVTPTTI